MSLAELQSVPALEQGQGGGEDPDMDEGDAQEGEELN